ncbi:uncharacterized protein LOC135469697 [Liolophura sinensis]|uniref:uncharacterized protein LOC135469697 n=1 Tax=Liolophura sinensis TaxID=3198878 RepID=UPI003159351C
MIQCDFCDEWFHPACVDLEEGEVNAVGRWYCPPCTDVMAQNPSLSRKGFLGFQGRVAPKEGWGEEFLLEDIDESVIQVETKRHCVEGWNLFREGRVTGLSSNKNGNYVYFRSQCQASMRQLSYNVFICFKGSRRLKWSTCSCPAGIDGQCKHLVATLYCLIDLYRLGINKIPDAKTCTQKLQMWHVRKPVTDEPLLFSDINFVKHDPERPVKGDLGCSVKQHNPVPEFASTVTQVKIQKLVNLYDSNCIKLPVIDTIRTNQCIPVLPKQQMDGSLHSELFELMNGTEYNFSVDDYTTKLTASEKQHYSSIVEVNIETSRCIEKKTRLQSKSKFWFDQRQHRITASNFGTFCRLKSCTNPITTFNRKQKFFTCRSVRHGVDYESAAFAKYSEVQPCESCSAGLIINPKIPYLGVSPDKIVLTNSELKLVEVKCPYSVFQKKVKICQQIKENNFYLKYVDGEVKLSETHDYFYQIQGQLNITGVNICDMVVFVPPDDIVIVSIKKDKHFFENKMLPKLSDIYFHHLLPSFVDRLQYIHL